VCVGLTLVTSRTTAFALAMKRYVSEQGVYVAFPGVSPPTGPQNDPAFTLLAPRVYWYAIEG